MLFLAHPGSHRRIIAPDLIRAPGSGRVALRGSKSRYSRLREWRLASISCLLTSAYVYRNPADRAGLALGPIADGSGRIAWLCHVARAAESIIMTHVVRDVFAHALIGNIANRIFASNRLCDAVVSLPVRSYVYGFLEAVDGLSGCFLTSREMYILVVNGYVELHSGTSERLLGALPEKRKRSFGPYGMNTAVKLAKRLELVDSLEQTLRGSRTWVIASIKGNWSGELFNHLACIGGG
jgi:hypothetical protein